MLIKNLITTSSYHRVLFSTSIFNDYKSVLKIRNWSTYSVLGNSAFLCSNYGNVLTNTNRPNQTQNIVHIYSLRYKTTKSQVPKEETTENANEKSSGTPLTRGQKLKKAVKEYGSTVIVFHIGISLISLGTCYLLVTSGLDITKIFTAIGLNDWLTKSQIAASAGTFAVAYAIHKVFAPARIAITLTSVPLIVRYLRSVGFLKK